MRPGTVAEMAYLAGVLDSDGCISIALSNHGIRPSFQPFVQIKQVLPEAVALALTLFDGHLYETKAWCSNGRPLYRWTATCRRAVACLGAVSPYLRIKTAQAENALAVAVINARSNSRQYSHDEVTPLLTPREAVEKFGLRDEAVIYGAVRLGMPVSRKGNKLWVRTRNIEELLAQRGGNVRPDAYTEELWRRLAIARDLNKVGRAAIEAGR